MRISEQALNQFIQIYNEEFGEELDRSAADATAFRVKTLYQLLATALPKSTLAEPKPPGKVPRYFEGERDLHV